MADPLTPIQEAFEQADDGVRRCWDAVFELIRGDLDRIASGTYRLADAATVGHRLLIVGVGNAFTLGNVMSDNLALLAVDPSGKRPPRRGRATVRVDVPAGAALTVRAEDLVGRDSGHRALRTRVSLDPHVIGAGPARVELVTLTLSATGLPSDTYHGELVVDGPDGKAKRAYMIGISGPP